MNFVNSIDINKKSKDASNVDYLSSNPLAAKYMHKQNQRVIFYNTKYMNSKYRIKTNFQSSNKPADFLNPVDIEWGYSNLYKLALKNITVFNIDKDPKIFNEEEIPNIISIINQIQGKERSYKMITYFFKKARNTIRKLLIELLHPELYLDIKRFYKTETQVSGLLLSCQNLMKTRKQLIILFIKILEWKVTF